MLNISQYFPITDPTLVFLVVLVIILFAPIIMGKLRIPHIIGMVLAGMIIGPYGLNLLERDASFELFGKVGLYYIIFLAALETDMEGMRKRRLQVGVFGLLSFAVAFLLTFLSSLWILGYGVPTSLLIGCIMGSSTLIAYPIVSRYGLSQKPSVTLSVGAAMVALFLSLVMLAAISAAYQGGGGIVFWVLFVVKVSAFCAASIFAVPRLARWFLRKYSDAVMQFIFVLAILFCSAATSQAIGVEGLFGAFIAGFILNRFIPRMSPLMNRIEFTGNALFIPYFLIGVGMLINIRVLFQGSHIIMVVLTICLAGTLGKAIAAYASAFASRLNVISGRMMFGLTCAHAAGAIAMVMVGMKITLPSGQMLVDDSILNAVVVMILFTCVVSSLLTDNASQKIIFRDKSLPNDDPKDTDDEKILVPVKYPEYAYNLISLAISMRNSRLKRSIAAINVVYDDNDMRQHQEAGQQLLDRCSRQAASMDVGMQTQVRVAANIANGIKHAFQEFRASEIVIGLHMHKDVSTKFWGEFHQSLFNGLNRQIIMARLNQPLNTLHMIQVVVPSRAEFEPGFYRWVERLARLAENLECRILFHGRKDSLSLIHQYLHNRHPSVRCQFAAMGHWNELPLLASHIDKDHLFVVVTARKGTVSYKLAQEKLPDELTRYYQGTNLMIIFPDQYGASPDLMTFAEPQHREELSFWEWFKTRRMK